MKTLPQIQKQLDALINSRIDLEKAAHETGKESALKKARKNAGLLKECKYYLETNPNKAFIKEQLDFNKRKLKQINEGFSDWKMFSQGKVAKAKDETQLLATYHSEMDRTKINFQIKVLNFLLD